MKTLRKLFNGFTTVVAVGLVALTILGAGRLATEKIASNSGLQKHRISPIGTAAVIPGKRIYFIPPEGGHYFALYLADVGENTDNPGIKGARLSQIVVFGASVVLEPDGLHTTQIPPDNGIPIAPAQITVPSAYWRLPTEFELSVLDN